MGGGGFGGPPGGYGNPAPGGYGNPSPGGYGSGGPITAGMPVPPGMRGPENPIGVPPLANPYGG